MLGWHKKEILQKAIEVQKPNTFECIEAQIYSEEQQT